MSVSILPKEDISYLNNILIKNGHIKIVDYSVYKKIPSSHIKQFCVAKGLYQLPTTELVNWVSEKIGDRKAIELASGNGVFAKALNITATDSRMQELPEVKFQYLMMQQPIVKYGKNIKKYEAKKAIKKYKPKVAVACWLTQILRSNSEQGSFYGADEEWIINNVDCYIHIGNRQPHQKRILKEPHEEYQFPWLVSRASHPEDNIIYVWGK